MILLFLIMRCTPTIRELIEATPLSLASLDRLPASRLLLPRSGLERSDFVPWHSAAEMWHCSKWAAIWGTPAVALTRSGRQHVTHSGHSSEVSDRRSDKHALAANLCRQFRFRGNP